MALPAYSQNYKAEIETFIVEPCFRYIVKHGELKDMVGEERAFQLFKSMSQQNAQQVQRVVLPVVKGKTLEQRKAIYEFAKDRCIQGAAKSKG